MFILRDRLGLLDSDLVAHLCGIAGVVYEIFFHALDELLIHRMLYIPSDGNRYRVLHGSANHHAVEHFSLCV